MLMVQAQLKKSYGLCPLGLIPSYLVPVTVTLTVMVMLVMMMM